MKYLFLIISLSGFGLFAQTDTLDNRLDSLITLPDSLIDLINRTSNDSVWNLLGSLPVRKKSGHYCLQWSSQYHIGTELFYTPDEVKKFSGYILGTYNFGFDGRYFSSLAVSDEIGLLGYFGGAIEFENIPEQVSSNKVTFYYSKDLGSFDPSLSFERWRFDEGLFHQLEMFHDFKLGRFRIIALASLDNVNAQWKVGGGGNVTTSIDRIRVKLFSDFRLRYGRLATKFSVAHLIKNSDININLTYEKNYLYDNFSISMIYSMYKKDE